MGIKQLKPDLPERSHAAATVTVHHVERNPAVGIVEANIVQLSLQESFCGDIQGESTVRALQLVRTNGSVSQVSMQTFRGTLGKYQGSFVLQGSGTVEGGLVKASWFVVPETGTDGLSGLRGEGGFEGEFGQGSKAWLEYWFE